MTDFIESLTGQIKHRLSSPIFGSFIIAWVCWNYQFIIVVFSSTEIQERLKLARAPYTDGSAGFWLLIGFPLLSAVAYIILYPLFSRPLLLYWEWQNRVLDERLTEAQKKRRLTEEESQKLILLMREQRTEFQEALARVEAENTALSKSLKEERGRQETGKPEPIPAIVQSDVDAQRDAQNTDRLKSLPAAELHAIIGFLTAVGSYQYSSISEHMLLEGVGPKERIRVRAGIESAIVHGLVKVQVEQDGTRSFSLTAKGTRVLLQGPDYSR